MTRLRRRLSRDHERGSAAIEAAVGVPAFVLFIGLIIFAGRAAIAEQAVQAAAAEAARAASIARTQAEAQTTGSSAGAQSLANQGLECATSSVTVDTSQFGTPAGAPAQVTATVTCVVNLTDLAVPGVPGTHSVTATMSSPIDTYRPRS